MRTSTTSRQAVLLQSLLSVFRLITILSLIFVNFQPNTRVSANSRAGYVEKVSSIQSSLLQTSFDFENNDPQGWVFSRNDPAQTSFLGVVSEGHLSFQKPSGGFTTGWWTYRYDVGSNKTNSSARFKCTFKHNGNFFAKLIVRYRDGSTPTIVIDDTGDQGPYPKQIDKELSASKEIASIEFGGNMLQGGSWIDNVVIEGLQSTRSEIFVDKNTAIANNEDPIQVTVAARDSNGDLLIGHSIRLDVSGSENTILGTNPATTDQSGLVNFTFTSKRAELKILSVVDLTTNVSLNTNQEVVFLAGPVDGSVSRVELGTGHEGAFPANGTSVPVTVTALDAYSNAVSGSTVTISVSPSNQINLIQPTLQTDTDGKSVGSISSTVRQSVTINAEIDGVTVTQSQPVTAIFGGVNLRLNISAQAKTNQGTSSTKAITGYPIAYTFQVTNTGPMSANGVTLVDQLPLGLSNQSGSMGCNATGQTVTCQVGTISSGQSREFEITAFIDPEVALIGYITNVATIQGDEATQGVEENPDNNTAELVTRVEPPVSILRIEPDISVLEVQPGETTTRQIKIYNSGLEDCQSITLTLPAHLSSWVSLNPSTITELGSGESAEVTLAAHPGAGNAYGQHLGLLKAVDDLGKESQLWLAVRVTNPTHAAEVTILNSQDSLVSGAVLKLSRNSSIYTRVDLDGTSTNYIPTQSSISNTEGKIVWENLEEGTYDYELSANYHEPLSGTLIVDSAGVHPTPAFRLTAISGLYLESWQSLMSVVAGKQVEQVFTVRNTGSAPLTELGIELNSNDGSELPGWVALSLPTPFPELGAENSLTFSLTAQPGTTILPGIYPVSLKIRAGGAQIEEAAVDIWVSSSSTRDVRFMVLDAEITDPQTNQPSAVRGGGRIILTRLRPEITSEGIQFQPQYSQAIDEQGQSLFTTLEIGEKYSYLVWAPHYLYEEGQVIVQATSAGEQVSAGVVS